MLRTFKTDSTCRLILAPGGTQQIAHTDFRGIRADSGADLDASEFCIDSGNNTGVHFDGACIWNGASPNGPEWSNPGNWVRERVPRDGGGNRNWQFGTGADIRADVDFPAASAVFPAFVEGRFRWFQGENPVVLHGFGNAVSGTALTASHFCGDIPLDPSGLPTPVSVVFNADPATAVAGTLAWSPTDLAVDDHILLRVGDSLLLTAAGPGNTLEIDPDYDSGGDFQAVHAGTPGDLFAHTFAEPGTHLLAARIDGQIVGTLEVTAVRVDLAGRAACQIGYTRTKDVAVEGAAPDAVSLETTDPAILHVSTAETTEATVRLNVQPIVAGDAGILVRLADARGTVLAHAPVDAFRLNLRENGGPRVLEVLPDDSYLVRSFCSITPHIPALDVVYHTHTAGITFIDSTREMTRSTDDYNLVDGVGHDTVDLIWQGALGSHPCHSMQVFQDGVQISE